MHKKYLLVFMLGWVLGPLWGQTGSTTGDNENIRDLAAPDNTMTVRTFDNRYQGIKGHPYIFQDWKKGSVTVSNGQQIRNVNLKYNVHRDELSLQRDSVSEVITLFNEQVSDFQIGIKSFKMVSNEEGNHFYEVLLSGTSELLARRHKILRKANYEGVYSADQPYDQFVKVDSEYYLQSANGDLVPLKNTVKSLAAALQVNEKQLKARIKANKFDIRKEMDLINTVALFLDTP